MNPQPEPDGGSETAPRVRYQRSGLDRSRSHDSRYHDLLAQLILIVRATKLADRSRRGLTPTGDISSSQGRRLDSASILPRLLQQFWWEQMEVDQLRGSIILLSDA